MVNLYTTNCPKCRVLEKKLQQKQVEFNIVEGADEIEKLGFSSAPILQVDNSYLEFSEAVDWINSK